MAASSSSSSVTTPLLPSEEALAGFVDYRGRPITRSGSGGWSAAFFVAALETATHFSYYGLSCNLISYLTGPFGETTAAAAAAANAWSGTAAMLPLLGALVGDSFLGRYRTIVLAFVLYVLGYGMMTFSSIQLSVHPPQCSPDKSSDASASCRPSDLQNVLFYVALYLIAIAVGGDMPCSLAFGADQFDPDDPKESASRASYFNWRYFAIAIGMSTAIVSISYVEETFGWPFGFTIICTLTFSMLVVFLVGSKRYRINVPRGESPLAATVRDFVSYVRNRQNSVTVEGQLAIHEAGCGGDIIINPAEDIKGVLMVLPIWTACLAYGVVFAQISTLFNKQGTTLDRAITPQFQLPSAALQSCGTITIIAFIPIYDRVLVPAVGRLTKNPSGITMLQRIGTGMAISLLTMVVAALVEIKRLRIAQDYGLVDKPGATIPMSWAWMVPQYILVGVGDVFTIIGLQEFFYDQMPSSLKSLGIALYTTVTGLGAFISSGLITIIDMVSRGWGSESWFSDNLNRAHLDYFYLLLGAISATELALFIYFAHKYEYRRA